MKKILKKVVSILLSAIMILSCFSMVTVFADSSDVSAAVSDAAKAYVASKGNDSTAAGLLSAVQAVASGATLDTTNDYFLYHAVDGCYDEDPDIEDRISIPGHDGYVSAIFTVGTERISVLVNIPHEEENLGVLSKISTSDENAADYFTFNENGSITAIDPVAIKSFKKIIIDSNVSSVNSTATVTGQSNKSLFDIMNHTLDCEVLVLRNKGVLFGGWEFRTASSSTKGWVNLKAVYMDDSITDIAYLSQGNADHTFYGCNKLKYFRFPENGTKFNVSYCDFMGCTALENVNFSSVGKLGQRSFHNTSSLYSVYLAEGTTAGTGDWGEIGGTKPATRKIMTYAQQQTATFARAAVLAKQAIDGLTDEQLSNPETAMEAVTASYEGKISGVTAEWIEELESNDFGVHGILKISNGTDSYLFDLFTPYALVGLSADYILSPSFDSFTTNYVMNVPNFVTSVDFEAVAVDGAKVVSIVGNGGLSEGENTVIITVETSDGKAVTYTIKVTRAGNENEALWATAKQAALTYVNEKQNDVTPAELLATVQTVMPEATLDTANDFYIKHSVPGVKDNDKVSGYPLSIEGTDGAVTAIFSYNGGRYSFNAVIPHETEIIDIDSFAIVGNDKYSDYFTYDESGNVTVFNKQVEKIILPEGYTGTIIQQSGDSLINLDTIKVVIINNQVTIANKAFYKWRGLKAVQFADVQYRTFVGWNVNQQIFQGCERLKYVKLPSKITSSYGKNLSNMLFYDCLNLENVNIPECTAKLTMSNDAFKYTRVRDFILTENIVKDETNDKNTFHTLNQTGTVNVVYYEDDMTFARASSLISASVSEMNVPTEDGIISAAKSAITGSHDALEFANGLKYIWTETENTQYKISGNLKIVKDTDYVDIAVSCSKTFAILSTDNYELNKKFSTDTLNYSVTVPYDKQKDLSVNAEAVVGAEWDISYDYSTNEIVATVVNTDGTEISYTVNVNFVKTFNAESLALLKKALLGVDGVAGLDSNKDGNINIIDLINLKKSIVTYNSQSQETAMNIPKIAVTRDGVSADDFKYFVSYMKDDEIVDNMFDGIILTPEKNWLFSYAANSYGNLANLSKRDWSDFIYNVLYKDGYNVDALDEAVGEMKQALGRENYKMPVYLPVILPVPYHHENAVYDETGKIISSTKIANVWGNINGQAIDVSTTAGSLAAIKWFIDEEVEFFKTQEYQNLELCGFYYVDELQRNIVTEPNVWQPESFILSVNDYIREINLESIWTPYYDANGYENWKSLGFDRATLQVNYFPGREDLPNAGTKDNISNTIDRAKELGTGIEMELASTKNESIEGLKDYMRGIILAQYFGFKNKFHTWWIQSDDVLMRYLYNSNDEYIHSAYDEIYKFIKGDLSYLQIK